MLVEKSERLAIQTEHDIVEVRHITRVWGKEIGLGLTDLTKIVTASSEIARNTLCYGGGGMVTFEVVDNSMQRGLRLVFCDQGPGIADLDLAMTDGYTSGSGMGLGLSGSKRLSDEFSVTSSPGQGTSVTLIKWK